MNKPRQKYLGLPYSLPQSPRHWVGYLTNKDNSSLVLYARELRSQSENSVCLYHYATNQIVKHDKEVVRPHLKPLRQSEFDKVEQVKAAYLETKLRYYRELAEFLRTSFIHIIAKEFDTLRYYDSGKGRYWYEMFFSDPDKKIKDESPSGCMPPG